MRKALALAFIAALTISAPAVSFAAAGPAVGATDANGKCHDAKGKFAKCPAPTKECKKGKPCGNTCIAVDKACHKPS